MDELIALTDEEQEALLERLTHHALCKMRRLTWRGARVVRGGSVPKGYEPYDFALDAIQQLLDDSRSWNREVYPTLESVLRSFVDSKISGMVNLTENKLDRRLTPPKGQSATMYDIPNTESDPLRLLIDVERQQQLHDAAFKEFDGDTLLENLFICIEDEITKPKDIASLLDMKVEEVNNGLKRLRRALNKLEKKFLPAGARAKS
ncbi:MAG: hypothetical protein IT422_02065 [Pirellulaceae bacterium]|nr:hypothetical protein [Pirellulaceae bacterium]